MFEGATNAIAHCVQTGERGQCVSSAAAWSITRRCHPRYVHPAAHGRKGRLPRSGSIVAGSGSKSDPNNKGEYFSYETGQRKSMMKRSNPVKNILWWIYLNYKLKIFSTNKIQNLINFIKKIFKLNPWLYIR